MSDHDMSNVPPDFITPAKIPERDIQKLAEMEARLTAMHNIAAPQPVAVVSDVYQSRYTIEWLGGSMPVGTVLFAVVTEADSHGT